MTVISRKWNNLVKFAHALREMMMLAWEADRLIFMSLILLKVFYGLTPVVTAWIYKTIIDFIAAVITEGNSADFKTNLLPLLILQGLLSVGREIIRNLSTYLEAELGRKLTLKSQTAIYDRIGNMQGLAYLENPEFYDIVGIARQGLYSGPARILNMFASMVSDVITLVSFAGVLLYISPVLALIIVAAALPQLFVQLRLGQQRFGVAFQNSFKERQASYLGEILSQVRFAKELRLFNLKDYFLYFFVRTSHDIHRTQRQQQLREMGWSIGLNVFSTIVSAVTFVVVILQAVEGRFTLGEVTLYGSALSNVQMAMFSLIYGIASLNESTIFFERYQELMALPSELVIAQQPRPVPLLKTGIELRNVSFRYTDNHPWVLKDINLLIPKGRCLALIGLNGAGKTTLVKLLTRLYDPTEGVILWDSIDIREFDVAEYRQRLSTIFQDFAHYDLSVQENIGIGDVDQIESLPQIHQAAKQAGIHDLVEGLEKDYQTVLSRWLVEEGSGVELSGGQWQSVAIARMFMRQAEFLILDEPTAALDAEAEEEVYNHFTTLVKGTTSLLISHRFTIVRMADLIAVLEGSQIVEYGSHEDLMLAGNTYAKLFTMQAEKYISS